LVVRGGNLLQRASVTIARGEVELRLGNLTTVGTISEELSRLSAALADKIIEVGGIALRARCAFKGGSLQAAQNLVSEALRALKGERGSLWFDLRLLESELWLAEGRSGKASTLLRTLLRAASTQGLLHIEARCGLCLGATLWEQGDFAGSRRAMARALKLSAREQYEQIVLDAAETRPEIFADAWAHDLESEWL